jgi:hypothetical protein
MIPVDGDTGYRPAAPEEADVTIDLFDATSGSLVVHGVAVADYDPPKIDVAQLQVSVLAAIAQVPAIDPDQREDPRRGDVGSDELGSSTPNLP